MNITDSEYTVDGSIKATIDGAEMTIPADPDNRHYAAIIAQGHTPDPVRVPTPEEALEAEREGMVASRFQAKAALMQAGHLSAVETAIEQADALTQLALAEAVEMRRTSPMIAALALAIDLTPEDVDDLFRVAMQIEA